MKINLEDRLVEELDSIFDNERTSQVEWDACIEDIVEEYIARHNGTWEELYCDDDEVEGPSRMMGSSRMMGEQATKPCFSR